MHILYGLFCTPQQLMAIVCTPKWIPGHPIWWINGLLSGSGPDFDFTQHHLGWLGISYQWPCQNAANGKSLKKASPQSKCPLVSTSREHLSLQLSKWFDDQSFQDGFKSSRPTYNNVHFCLSQPLSAVGLHLSGQHRGPKGTLLVKLWYGISCNCKAIFITFIYIYMHVVPIQQMAQEWHLTVFFINISFFLLILSYKDIV